MTDTYTAKARDYSEMLVIGHCSSILKQCGTNSVNMSDSIFCTRLGGTGEIDEPGVSAEVPKWVEEGGNILRLGRSMITCKTWETWRIGGVTE